MTFTNASTGFQNPVIAGSGELVIEDIHSRGYTPGVQGWSIDRNGSAEFNDITIRDRIEIGPDSGPQVVIDSTPTFGYIEFPTHGVSENMPARILSALLNPGAANEAGSMQIDGPSSLGATDRIELQLNAQNNDATSQANFNLSRKDVANSWMLIADKNDMLLSPSTNLRMQQFNGAPMTFIKLNAVTVQVTQGLLTGLTNLSLSGNLDVTGTTTTNGPFVAANTVHFTSMTSNDFMTTLDETGFNSTAYTPGANVVGEVFTAPPSGQVDIFFSGRLNLNVAAAVRILLSVEVRNGGTIGAGTVFAAADDDWSIECGVDLNTRISAGILRFIVGLTPGATYNARLMHRNAVAAVGAGTIFARNLSIRPVFTL